MNRRIFGLETEFGIKYYPGEEDRKRERILSETDVFEILNSILERDSDDIISNLSFDSNILSPATTIGSMNELYPTNKHKTFLGNGARFYMDTGFHPEYATPECRTPRDVVLYDKAGERLLEDLVIIAQREIERAGYTGTIFVCKNNVDILGNTYGCHENFLIKRLNPPLDENEFFKKLIRQLIPFLVTRQIFTGAGKLFSGDNLYFQISQRSDHIDTELSSSTTSIRGIINSRDEAHANKEKYRRLHLIIGDSNMSELINYLKVGITGLILDMIDEDQIDIYLTMDKPVLAMKNISHDISMKKKIRLRNGQDVSPIEIQREYLFLVKKFIETHRFNSVGGPKEANFIVSEWERILNLLDTNPMELSDTVDWIAKKWVLNRYLEKMNCTFEDIERWSFFIRKIKNLAISPIILSQMKSGTEFLQYLKDHLSEIDFVHLNRNIKINEINLDNFRKIYRVYHGILERDLRYHDICQEKSIFYLLQNSGFMRKIPNPFTDEEIQLAKIHPPLNTRARIRGAFVRAINRKNLNGGVKWDVVCLYGEEMKKVELSDPFKSTSKKVKELLEEAEADNS
ncbi:MAG: hypothetical protein A2161_05900 [Candidatus Schekmanbacteria bacterium RBG_13_48_7]|uniref:Pup--protein ligase n=1 Tax=Candidatus Schekmanbacteria bacterium RBG_13_48_7 TaxID=1817878 RepID=A0A1F7RTY0_9BACT|nr:MAG: hypothetical protein A2161_05900 [Candidatus Schekmanbacteria bacterium RBG_13_48_7]